MPYHHGTLRPALIEAALGLARSGGPDEVVLRAATRAAGVSHNAAYRHFADRNELLGAVRDECLRRLAGLMQLRLAELAPVLDPVPAAWRRLEAAGFAYVEFALTEPGWFRTAFSSTHNQVVLPGRGGSGGSGGSGGLLEPGGDSPYDILSVCLDGLVAAGALPPDRRPGAELPAWSAVHGIASLLLDGPLRDLGPEDQAQVIQRVVLTVGSGL